MEAELASAVYELLTVEPHSRPGARYTQAEWRAYHDGYGMGVATAVEAIGLAAGRRKIRERFKRQAAAEQRAAAKRLLEPVQHHVRELVRIQPDEIGQAGGQGGNSGDWHAESHTLLCHGVADHHLEPSRGITEIERDRDVAENRSNAHAPDYDPLVSGAQIKTHVDPT